MRKQISEKAIDGVIYELRQTIKMRLEEKGYGSFASKHEILGILEEEMKEYVDAVHENVPTSYLSHELMDIAVACVFGCACIEEEGLDW